MKLFIFLLSILLLSIISPLSAQNKIGENPQDIKPASLLELESVSKGLRLSRIQLDDVNAWTPMEGTPVSGMLIFNETGTAPKGLYYWNMTKSQWVRVINTSELAALIAGSTTVENNVTDNKLTTTVNGVSSIGEDIIKSNHLSIVNGELTSIANGVASPSGVYVLASADNGLAHANGNVQLGGVLTKPTSISTSSVNTLSVIGLQTGDATNDNLLTVGSGSGEIHEINTSSLALNGDVSGTLGASSVDKLKGTSLFFTSLNSGDLLQYTSNGWANWTPNYLTGNQSITFTSSGDITGTTTGTTSLSPTLTIGSNAVSYSKLQQVGANSLLGNPTGSLANAQEITLGSGLSFTGTTIATANIPNASLVNSKVTINGTDVSLGGTATITASAPNKLSVGTGLTGTDYDGSAAQAWSIDNTKVPYFPTGFSSGYLKYDGTNWVFDASVSSNFNIGTGGTDFNIQSTGNTHTFNLPDATATHRGALNSTDWSLFNNKIGVVTATTPAAVSTSGTTATIQNTDPYWNANQVNSANVPVSSSYLATNASGQLVGAVTPVTSITGTADQVIASASTGAVTLSLPQSIATTSSPSFSGLTVSGLNTAGLVINNGTGVLSTSSGTGLVKMDGSGNVNYDNSTYLTGNQSITFTASGDITGTATGTTSLSPSLTIGSNAVTYSKLQQVGASSLIGNPTGSVANAQEITLGSGLSFTGTTLATANIPNASLVNSKVTINGTDVSLGGTATITASAPNKLSAGTGLTGTDYDGSAAQTWSVTPATGTSLGGVIVGTGLSVSSGTVSVNASQHIATLSNLTTAGVVHNNATGDLSSSPVNLGLEVTGILPVSNGGTGVSTVAIPGGLVYGVSSTALGYSAAGNSGQILVSGGTSTPTWMDATSLPVSNIYTTSASLTGNRVVTQGVYTLGFTNSQTTGTAFGITGSGVYTGTEGLFNVTANSATTGTLATISSNSLTGGNLLTLTNSNASQLGAALNIVTNTTGGAAEIISAAGNYTGTGLFNLTANSATTGTLAVINGTGLTSGTALQINTNSLNGGKALSITSTGTNTTGNLLAVSSSSTGAFGSGGNVAFAFSGAHTGSGVGITDATTTGTALGITGAGAYTGSGLFAINGNSATTGTLASINSSSLTTGTGLSIIASNSSLNSTNGLLYVANTSNGMNGIIGRIQSNSAVVGSGLTVLANGRIGVGTSSPIATLHNSGATVLGVTTASNSAATYMPSQSSSVDNYSGIVIVNSADCSMTLPAPSDNVAGRIFTVFNSQTSSSPLTVCGMTLVPGAVATFQWDGYSAWVAPMGQASSIPLSGLTAAIADNSITNGDFAQTWNWNSSTTINPFRIATSSLTSGTLFSLANSNTSHTGNVFALTSNATSPTAGIAQLSFVGNHSGNGVEIDDVTTTGSAIAVNGTGTYTGSGLFKISANATTSGTVANINADGLTTGTALSISSASTVATGGQLLNVVASGANGTAGRTNTAVNVANTHTGTTSTNVGLAVSASGGTNNYALIVPSGSVGIGTSAPVATFHNTGATVLGVMARNTTASTWVPTNASSVDLYSGVVVKATGTSDLTLTLPDPTNTMAGRLFTVSNSISSTKYVKVSSCTLPAGMSVTLVWDGAQWAVPLASPITVVNSTNLFSTGLSNTGSGVTSTINSNFFGLTAGSGATAASNSNFFGASAGSNAVNASNSNFLGQNAGSNASGAYNSNFIGQNAGSNATGAYNATFLGQNAGQSATNANGASFIGYNAGYNASGASYSTLLGYNVANEGSGSHIGSNNVIIGTNITLPGGTANGINIGGVLFGTNTYAISSGDPSSAATTSGSIGVGVVSPTARLHLAAGSDSPSLSPLKFSSSGSGILLTTPEPGAMEYDGDHLYFTVGDGAGAGVRYQLDQQGLSLPLSSLTKAVASNIINNDDWSQVWNWNSSTTKNPFTIASTSLTTGNLFSLANSNASQSGNVLSVTSNATAPAAGIAQFNFSGAHTGNGMQIDDATTSGSALAINATGAYTSTSGLVKINANSATSGTIASINANALTTGTALDISSTSTGMIAGGQLLKIAMSGNNTTASSTTTAVTISNAHGGTTPTNIGLSVSANGGAKNYALIVPLGNVGIGTTAPASTLDVKGQVNITQSSGTGYIGLKAPSSLTSYTLTLPTAKGNNGQILSTDASGNLGWTNGLTTSLADGSMFVGNSSGVATPVAMGGDATLSNTGVLTLKSISGVAGTYGSVTGIPTFTVDGNGRVTVASTVATTDIAIAGDVSGSLGVSSVDKLKGTALSISGLASGDVLKYDGTNWINAMVALPASTAAAYTLYGNNTGSATTPDYFTPVLASELFSNQGTTSTVLHGNASGTPTWGAVNLAADVTGTLPITHGGTGIAIAATPGGVVYGASTSALGYTSAGTSGQILISGGASTPTWADASTLTVKNIYTSDGALTANRTVSQNAYSLGFANSLTTGSAFNITGSGVYTGSGLLSVANNALTTGTLASITTTNGSLNSANGLLYVANMSTSTNGIVGRIQSNNTSGSGLTVLANGNVGIGTTAPASTLDVKGQVNITQSSGTGYIGLKAPSSLTSYTLTLPTAKGNNGQILSTDASGNLGWTNGLTTSLADGSMFLGNSSGVATPVAMSGDATLSNAGVLTLKSISGVAGTYGSVTGIPTFTVDGNGRVTVVSTVATTNVAIAGDVSGTLGVSSVDKLKGTALSISGLASGDVLKYDGSSWVNTSVASLGTISLATGTTGSNVNVSGSPAALGGTITLNIPDAGASARGLVTAGDQTFAGIKTFNSAIAAPTSGNTINGLIVNAGALSGVTGYAQTAGNFSISGTGSFATGTGAIALNGNTTLDKGKTLTLSGGTSGAVSFAVPATVPTSYTLTLPSAQGGNGQILQNDGAGKLSWVSGLTNGLTSGNIFVGNSSDVATPMPMTGDATISNTGVLTLKTISGVAGSYGSATSIPSFTVDGNGRVTVASNVAATIAGDVSGTLTASSVDRLKGTALSISSLSDGNILKYDGATTSWKNVSIALPASTASAYTVYGNNTNGSAAPTYFTPTLASALFANQGTTTTVLHGNASGNPSWSAIDLTADVTGILPVANGGTGNASLTANGILYGNGTGAIQATSVGTAGDFLTSSGSGAPTWTHPSNMPNIYTADGTLIANRTVTQNGYTLDFTNSLTTGSAFGITGSGNYTGTGLFNLTANTATTGTLALINGTGLTSGTALQINVNSLNGGKGLSITSTGVSTTGNLLAVTSSSAGAFGTGGNASFTFTGAHTGTGVGITDVTATGTALGITSSGTYTGAGLFSLTANSATSGTLAAIASSSLTTGTGLSITATNTSLNSTSGLLYVANTTSATTGTIARIQSNNTAGAGLTVLASGNVGVGNAAPTVALDVTGNGQFSGNLTVNGSINAPSDIRLKTHIETLTNVLEKIDNLRGVRYEFIDQKKYATGSQIGVIAQELQKEFPELVVTKPDGYLAVNYTQLTGVLIQAIKEQQQEIKSMKESLDLHTKQIESMMKMIQELKAK